MIPVTYFQRKPRKGFNYSFEFIFEDLRRRLQEKVSSNLWYCPKYNSGLLSIVVNMLAAGKVRTKTVRHITGEVHFINMLMQSRQSVLTIHDCRMVYRKKGLARQFVRKIYLDWPVQKATVITAVSETTRNEIISLTGNNKADIRVIPVAIDPIYQPCPKVFNAKKPVLLTIGLGPNKNFERLVAAIAGLHCSLNIIGRLSDLQTAMLKEHNIEYTNAYGLSQEQMLEQYQRCDILCFVSTFEGFGMPIVEANAVGRPVLTSNISSMPEVAGKAACLVDPYDIKDIRNGLERIIGDKTYRSQLIESGFENCKRFDANTIAASYYAIYRELWKAG